MPYSLRPKYVYSSHIILFILVFLTLAPKATAQKTNNRRLVFKSGFEGSVEVVSKGKEADIIGQDRQAGKSNWTRDIDENPNFGTFSIQFEGGDSTMRKAQIVADPLNNKNKVLKFSLMHPNVQSKKGRVQANLYGTKGIKEIYQEVQIYLPPDLNTLSSYPAEINWLTIAEFWNNITWNTTNPYGFRITLGIGKTKGAGKDLFFDLKAEKYSHTKKYSTVWHESNQSAKVPIGRWFNLIIYFKEGNETTGRFYLAIKEKGEKKNVIYDVHNFTQHPKDPSPNGLTDFNPLKLYTSKELIEYMNSRHKSLEIFWDDFYLKENKKPRIFLPNPNKANTAPSKNRSKQFKTEDYTVQLSCIHQQK